MFTVIFNLSAQTTSIENPKYFSTEVNLGYTFDANSDFPDTKIQKSIFASLGWIHCCKDQEWARRLKNPKTGLTIGYTDFGNLDKIGYALTIAPFLEIKPFAKKNERWKLKSALGISYLSKQFDSITNPTNRAVSSDFKWSFRTFLYYELNKQQKTKFRLGIGYTHHSNGHTSLPNQGLNSVVASVEAEFLGRENLSLLEQNKKDSVRSRHISKYLTIRTGIGQNVLSPFFNDRKEVYTVAVSTGKVINSTFRWGVGIFYRVYEHYYDYIKDEEWLVEELYPFFKENPVLYASNFGVMAEGELLLGHVGVEAGIGINIFKPAYKIDWHLNDGFSYRQGDQIISEPGELDAYYEMKRSIPARLGLKWYFRNTSTNLKHNVYLGAHINANLGQADFTELSIGYEYRFRKK